MMADMPLRMEVIQQLVCVRRSLDRGSYLCSPMVPNLWQGRVFEQWIEVSSIEDVIDAIIVRVPLLRVWGCKPSVELDELIAIPDFDRC